MQDASGVKADERFSIVKIRQLLSEKVVGQDAAMARIVPTVQMYLSGLAPEGRPAGVFLLLGPTGTGKTRTVEALAEVLHGSSKMLLKIDCAEFQMEHEVAKLIGAPPGYVGHAATECLLSEANLRAVTTPGCELSIVLFDEVEKSAPSLALLLLGLLDRASIRLGDGKQVSFENSLIFFTSNLGAREMMAEMGPALGFLQKSCKDRSSLKNRLEQVSGIAVQKRFSPEFINRIDSVITYQPLNPESLATILNGQIANLQNHVNTRLGSKRFRIELSKASHTFLLEQGTSSKYGARELQRVVSRMLTQPLAAQVVEGKIPPGAIVRVDIGAEGTCLEFSVDKLAPEAAAASVASESILIVDDNVDLRGALVECFQVRKVGARILGGDCADAAINAIAAEMPTVALLDRFLPDGNGVMIGVQMKRKSPSAQVIIMSGSQLHPGEEALCEEYGLHFLQKPFLAEDAFALVQAGLTRVSAGN